MNKDDALRMAIEAMELHGKLIGAEFIKETQDEPKPTSPV